MEANKAILIDCSPKLKCCVFSKDYGPICVSSFDDQTGLLDVDSISLLGIIPFAMRLDQSNMIDHVYEEFLFRNDNHGGQSVSQLDRHQRNFMEEVSLIKGLRERLLDSSRIRANANSETTEAHALIERSSIISTRKTNRYLPFRTFDRFKRRRIIEFINKSESVIGELLSAHGQFRRQQKNNSAIMIEQGKSLDFSEEYFEGLYYNVGQVQTLLDSTPGEHYVELNDKMTKVSIHFFDEKGREHNLVGELPPQFPSNPPTWTCDLPIDFVPQWKIVSKASNEASASSLCGGGLYDCVALFIELVSSYQLLWNELEDLDTNLWVIDPPLPARFSCTNRRIMIKPGLSTVISLEPENPRAIPLSMRLIGNGSEIEKYRTQYELYTSARYPQQHINFQESKLWCEQQSIRFNLETCFQCSLPKTQISNDGTNKIECAICYSHILSRHDSHHGDSDEVPNIKCSNGSCARNYHQSCLIEWIRSIPGSKLSFGRIFGSCPYCYETISVLIN